MKRIIAMLLVLSMSFAMLTYTVWADDANDDEETIEDMLTEDTLEEIQGGAAPDGFDPNAAQIHRDGVFESEAEVEAYTPTELTI